MRDKSKRNKQKHRVSLLDHWSIWSLMLTICVLSVSTSQNISYVQCFIMHNMAPDRNFYYCSICINCIVLSTNAGMNHISVNLSSSRHTCTITIFFLNISSIFGAMIKQQCFEQKYTFLDTPFWNSMQC